jgi:uncharacterized protein YbaA (DUF1428 family)
MATTKYVDGFVIPLPKDKIDLYRSVSEKACRIWKEHGALEFRECVGDDLEVTDQVSFTHLAGAKPDETVLFSWIVFESRESRDQVNAKVMADPRRCVMRPIRPLISSGWLTADSKFLSMPDRHPSRSSKPSHQRL